MQISLKYTGTSYPVYQLFSLPSELLLLSNPITTMVFTEDSKGREESENLNGCLQQCPTVYSFMFPKQQTLLDTNRSQLQQAFS